jgi:hypothetical protein
LLSPTLMCIRRVVAAQFPDGKLMQVNLTGFFERKTPEFMRQLWTMLLSAQESVGMPKRECARARGEAEREIERDSMCVCLCETVSVRVCMRIIVCLE